MLVPYLAILNKDMAHISHLMNFQEKHAIAVASWPEFDYKPEVSVSVAHGNDHLYLKYFVREDSIRAFYRNSNDPVYKDSCVEFFVSLDKKTYYNFEFNSLSTCLAGFGPGRGSRSSVDDAVIS